MKDEDTKDDDTQVQIMKDEDSQQLHVASKTDPAKKKYSADILPENPSFEELLAKYYSDS